MKQLKLQLQVYDGKTLLAQQVFDQSKIVIGRILSADFRVPDARISRIHALLERTDEGTFRLTDLASSHGSKVNGEKIIERVVGPADQIELAGLKLQLSFLRVEAAVEDEESITVEKTQVVEKKSQGVQAQVEAARAEVEVDSGGSSSVRKPRDPTQIRSLKETARSRGALDSHGSIHEELEFTVYWEETILNIEHIRGHNRVIKIGEAETNDYVVPSAVLPKVFEFVRVQSGSAQISFHPSMKGSVRVGGDMQTLEQLQNSGKSSVTIQGSDIAKIQIGNVNFFLMFVSNPPAIPRDDVLDQGQFFWLTTIAVGLFVGALMLLATQFEAPIEGRVKEFPERVRKIIVQAYKKQVAPPVVGDKAQDGVKVLNASEIGPKAHQAGNDPGEGSRAKGEEGKSGRPDATRDTGVNNVVTKNANNKRPRPMRLPVTKQPKTLLESLRASGLGNKIAKSGSGSGTDDSSLDKAFQGHGGSHGDGRGNGGLGLQGTGPGGGNKVDGVGGLGTKGFGAGSSGTGQGAGVFAKGEAGVSTETLNVVILGGLSREEIIRVVNSHQREVFLCYQRIVQLEPGLQGKLDLFWQIGDGGKVQNIQVKGNTTGSSTLADCVVDRVRSWQFPSPPTGSVSDVNWPWTMKPPGK
jgi:pSer/pThr/pTyr-binding forkhead associated (FHA) protein